MLRVEDRYCCQLHNGVPAPLFELLGGKTAAKHKVLHQAGSAESWNHGVQQRNESSESCPHSARSHGSSQSSSADTGQLSPWNIFRGGRIARCWWLDPALRNHITPCCCFAFPSSCGRAQQGAAAKAERLKSICAAGGKQRLLIFNFLTLVLPAPSQGPKPSICRAQRLRLAGPLA